VRGASPPRWSLAPQWTPATPALYSEPSGPRFSGRDEGPALGHRDCRLGRDRVRRRDLDDRERSRPDDDDHRHNDSPGRQWNPSGHLRALHRPGHHRPVAPGDRNHRRDLRCQRRGGDLLLPLSGPVLGPRPVLRQTRIHERASRLPEQPCHSRGRGAHCDLTACHRRGRPQGMALGDPALQRSSVQTGRRRREWTRTLPLPRCIAPPGRLPSPRTGHPLVDR
jgi:hypothetical protein